LTNFTTQSREIYGLESVANRITSETVRTFQLWQFNWRYHDVRKGRRKLFLFFILLVDVKNLAPFHYASTFSVSLFKKKFTDVE